MVMINVVDRISQLQIQVVKLQMKLNSEGKYMNADEREKCKEKIKAIKHEIDFICRKHKF